MTVGDKPSRKRRLAAGQAIRDISAGDFVRRRGHRGVGLVEQLTIEQACGGGDWAWVDWMDGRKDYLPLVALRKVRAGGHEFDARKRP